MKTKYIFEPFQFIDDELTSEGVQLKDIANTVGTPCYIYSKKAIETNWQAFKNALDHAQYPHQINYAVKANSNLSILNILSKLGSGFDIVSGGELERVLKAGGNPKSIVFSGVGKSTLELTRAVEVGIGCINVESLGELERLNAIANQMNKIIPIAARINPGINPKTHPYISTGLSDNKFGIDIKEAVEFCVFAKSLPNVSLQGIACHIGSQLTELSPFLETLDKLILLIEDLKKSNVILQHLNFGGGLGVRYHEETPPTPAEYVSAILARLKAQNIHLTLHLEPGRSIVANAGILLTRVEYIKNQFAIVDAAMTDLKRPALYNAWHNIKPVSQKAKPNVSEPEKEYDIVGPVCESGDFLGKKRKLCIIPGDLLAIFEAGAYGFSMSSHYNSRPKPAEVLIDNQRFHIIRPRESISDLFAKELVTTYY